MKAQNVSGKVEPSFHIKKPTLLIQKNNSLQKEIQETTQPANNFQLSLQPNCQLSPSANSLSTQHSTLKTQSHIATHTAINRAQANSTKAPSQLSTHAKIFQPKSDFTSKVEPQSHTKFSPPTITNNFS